MLRIPTNPLFSARVPSRSQHPHCCSRSTLGAVSQMRLFQRRQGQKTRLFLDDCCFCGLLGQIHPRSLIQKVSLGAKSFLLGLIWVSTQRSELPRARQLSILTWRGNTRAQKTPIRPGGFLVQARSCGARSTCNLEPPLAYPKAVRTALWAGAVHQAREGFLV